MKPVYRCSICDKEVRYDGPLPAQYPFCSNRCQMVDLSRWFNEQYTIDRGLGPEESWESLALPDESQPF